MSQARAPITQHFVARAPRARTRARPTSTSTSIPYPATPLTSHTDPSGALLSLCRHATPHRSKHPVRLALAGVLARLAPPFVAQAPVFLPPRSSHSHRSHSRVHSAAGSLSATRRSADGCGLAPKLLAIPLAFSSRAAARSR